MKILRIRRNIKFHLFNDYCQFIKHETSINFEFFTIKNTDNKKYLISFYITYFNKQFNTYDYTKIGAALVYLTKSEIEFVNKYFEQNKEDFFELKKVN